MKHVEYLVLGAGVSGLAFAGAMPGQDLLILEKEKEAGGYCRTIRRGDYVWDFAGHFFHFQRPELRQRFREVTAAEDTVHRVKNTRILYHGMPVDYPFQTHIHQLPQEEMIDCLYDLAVKEEKDSYGSFLDMLYGKFGRSITEKFLRPYNEKVYACDLDTLDPDAMGRFFPYADLRQIIRSMKEEGGSSYNQEFYYPRGGAEVFVRRLLDGIPAETLHLEERVLEIRPEEKTVRTDREEYRYGHLISSLPLNKFTEMLSPAPGLPEDVFSWNQVLVLNLGFDRPPLDRCVHWIYVPDRDINFYRAGFYNNILGDEKLSMYIEIGYSRDAVITEQEIGRQLELTLQGLKKLGILQEHRLADHCALVMNPAYVHITRKSMETVAALQEQLRRQQIHLTGRYGGWKYCSIEDCIAEALLLAQQLQA